jgi:hypothetical protein
MIALAVATSGATIAAVIGMAVSWLRKPSTVDHLAIEAGVQA